MKIAIEGCAHGELERIYDTIEYLQQSENIKVDLLLCCGDFQSTRNLDDLQTMAVPKKYQDICTFYKYYSGEKKAPILTIFIGGNHEASNYLQELPYGGWVAPNIYYLGLAGCVKINGIRIAGISGIYKGHDYQKGHYEFSPYSEETIRSVYHVRQVEVFRLKQLSEDIDICISHDWPRGVYNYGNYQQLIRFKPHFREEIEENRLGSPPCMEILNQLKPKYWFAAHLHCKFSALIHHDNSDKITKFLALDKCLPRRRFLQIIDIESIESEDIKFEYDLEWLTILNTTNHLISVKTTKTYMPGPNGTERYDFTPTEAEKELVFKKFNENLIIPENFNCTVEPYKPNDTQEICEQPKSQLNPQTIQFCELLNIDDPLNIAMQIGGHELNYSSILETSADPNNTLSFLNETDECDLNSSNEKEFPVKRKLINLPEPKEVAEEDVCAALERSGTSETVEHKEIELEASFNNSINERIEENKNQESSSVKKFKRRNQSIYENLED